MRTTGEFFIHRYEIHDWEYNKPTYLFPFGDVHKSSPMHHAAKWRDYLSYISNKERAYFLGMGDYDDLASTSERKILGNTDLHESTVKTLEQIYLDNTKRFAKDIEFMKGRIIGLMSGNHFGHFQNGTTTDQKLCELLSCKYLGVATLIRLSFMPSGGHNTAQCVDICAHHGRGSARTIGGSMNPVFNLSNVAEADIYLMGDNHQKEVAHKERLCLKHGGGSIRLGHKQQLYARTGSYLKAYEEGERSYIVDLALPPANIGSVKIELTPKRDRKDSNDFTYIDIHASV